MQNAARMPPLALSACVSELEVLGVPMSFAEEEADSPTAELAQRRGGFAVSNGAFSRFYCWSNAADGTADSDYFIFPARCRGYVPFNEIDYGPNYTKRLERETTPHTPSLRLRVYQHERIASSLSLPSAFLPIFASLIGNDLADHLSSFSLASRAPYPGQVSPIDLEHIARTLKTQEHLPASNPSEILAILTRVVPLLLRRPSSDPNILTALASSAASYLLHPLESPSPSFPLHPIDSDTATQAQCRALYLAAFKEGRIGSVVLQIIKHHLVVPPRCLENPDFQSCSITLGRPIRMWMYAIIEDAVGLDTPEINEYVRRGDVLHLAPVPVNPLFNLLTPLPTSALLLPSETRLQIFLTLLAAPPSLFHLPLPPLTPLLLSLRHIQSQSKHPWSRPELLAAILAALTLSTSLDLPTFSPPVELTTHAIHRSAELVTALFHVGVLAETLLVTGEVEQGHRMFEGAVLHGFLGVGDLGKVVRELEEAVRERVEELLKIVME